MAARPNIVCFMVDQLSAKWLEAAPRGVCELPNVTRLAAEGVTFRQAISSNPVCCPARATLATGLTSRQHGVLENGYALDPALPTFMQALQGAGWRTGALGKVHFRPHFAGLWPDYRPYGFDVAHITEDGRGGEWLDWVEQEHPEHFEAALATIWASSIPDFAAYGPQRRDLRPRIQAAREARDWRTPEMPEGAASHYALPFPAEVGQTEWITRHAEDFIADTPAGQPLFAHISYVQPHSPFNAPGEYFARVHAASIPPPLPAAWRDDPLRPPAWADAPWQHHTLPADWRARRHCYFADLVHLDAQLGRVRAALEAAGRWANTLLLFVADHGEMLLDHNLHGKGNMHYDACVRVPLILAGPGLRQGAARDELVQLEDLCPTILEAAGLPAPELPRMGPYLRDEPGYLPGRSVLGLARGETPPGWRRAAYVESYNNITSADAREWARTVRTARYRYTWYPGSPAEQLFDLAEDPGEQRNLAAESTCRAIRDELREALLEAIVRQDDPHPLRNLFAIGVH